MAKGIHTESTFEQAIESNLLENGGYVKGSSTDYEVQLGLFPSYITNFLKHSQPKAWDKIANIHKEDVEKKVIQRLVKEIDLRGVLDVIRKGFTDFGVKFQIAYFMPESTLNPEAEELYKTNHLSVTRQLYYERVGKNSLDMVLSLNGLPIATIELKNQFSGQSVENAKKQYVAFASGSGITPIMGISKSILVNEPESKVTLLFCSRNEDQIIFKKEFEQLKEKYPEKLEIIHNLSQPSPTWSGMKGRLDSIKLKEVLSWSEHKGAESLKYFVCGPEGLMTTTLNTFKELNIPSELIHEESFYTDLDAKETALKASGEMSPSLTREITVNVEGQDYTYEVAPEKTILEAGLDNSIDMPYSCQSGLCTACRGRLVSGKVDMIEDAGLSESEIAEGYILCCSSKPASSDIKIIIE